MILEGYPNGCCVVIECRGSLELSWKKISSLAVGVRSEGFSSGRLDGLEPYLTFCRIVSPTRPISSNPCFPSSLPHNETKSHSLPTGVCFH